MILFVFVFEMEDMTYAEKKLRHPLHVSHRETEVPLATQNAASSAIQTCSYWKCDAALLSFYVSEGCLPCGKADWMIKNLLIDP